MYYVSINEPATTTSRNHAKALAVGLLVTLATGTFAFSALATSSTEQRYATAFLPQASFGANVHHPWPSVTRIHGEDIARPCFHRKKVVVPLPPPEPEVIPPPETQALDAILESATEFLRNAGGAAQATAIAVGQQSTAAAQTISEHAQSTLTWLMAFIEAQVAQFMALHTCLKVIVVVAAALVVILFVRAIGGSGRSKPVKDSTRSTEDSRLVKGYTGALEARVTDREAWIAEWRNRLSAAVHTKAAEVYTGPLEARVSDREAWITEWRNRLSAVQAVEVSTLPPAVSTVSTTEPLETVKVVASVEEPPLVVPISEVPLEVAMVKEVVAEETLVTEISVEEAVEDTIPPFVPTQASDQKQNSEVPISEVPLEVAMVKEVVAEETLVTEISVEEAVEDAIPPFVPVSEEDLPAVEEVPPMKETAPSATEVVPPAIKEASTEAKTVPPKEEPSTQVDPNVPYHIASLTPEEKERQILARRATIGLGTGMVLSGLFGEISRRFTP